MEQKKYQNCYVAFIDMLGFKNLINSKETSCKRVLDVYKCFDNAIPTLEIGNDSERHFVEELKYIKMKIMSDSICIYIEAHVKNALLCLASVCFNIQEKLLTLAKPILIRGAIVHGDIYAEGDITFGPAVTKAYLMEENNAKYPRIIITKQTLDEGAKQIEDGALDSLYDGVFFRDADKFYTINFLATIDYESLQKLKAFVSDILDTTIDDSIREKYLYLDRIIMSKPIEGANNA